MERIFWPDATNRRYGQLGKFQQMQPHTYTQTSFGQSARRRIRRTTGEHRLFCTTNGCATYMQPDNNGQMATCPICGARQAIH